MVRFYGKKLALSLRCANMSIHSLATAFLLTSSVLTASAKLIAVTQHRAGCSASSTRAWPSCTLTHAVDTCGFDVGRGRQIGFVGLADPDVRSEYYTSSSDGWLVGDMPSHEIGIHRRFSLSGVWDDVSNFVSDVSKTEFSVC